MFKYYRCKTIFMRKDNEKLKVIVLTDKDRKLLQSINKSLKDIQRGKVKEFIIEELKKHK